MFLTLSQKDKRIGNLSRRFREKDDAGRQVKLDGSSSNSSLMNHTDCKIDDLNTPTELRSSFESLLKVSECKLEHEYPYMMKQTSSVKPDEEKLEEAFSVGKPPWRQIAKSESALNKPPSNEYFRKNRTLSSITIKDTKSRRKAYRANVSLDLLWK